MPHKQVWVKGNAHVDEGVAALIQALSSFPNLQTIESCQGEPSPRPKSDREEGLPALVFFTYGLEQSSRPYQNIADFVLGYLGPGLNRTLGDLVNISLQITDYGTRCDLIVRDGAVQSTVRAIRRLRREFPVL